jgi:membrane-bound serine protease (ClpP class)
MKFVAFALLILFSFFARAECTMSVTLSDSISAATVDILQRVVEKTDQQKCSSILVRINTPGGDLQSTRLITELILASKQPFLCLISPMGGHAGSAGAIILQACHVSGGLTATNVGAATPILQSGQQLPDDLRKKILNDTVSWVQGLAELRGRSPDFAKKIVTEAMAVTSNDAVKLKGLDLSTATEKDFLTQAAGRTVLGADKSKTQVITGPQIEFLTDTRYQILKFVSDPEWAYLLFLGALLLLYAEFSHPGLVLPGVSGAVLFILSMMAFNKLDANTGGLVLMILGLGFWIAELFFTSKGILGAAGTISFLLGSFLLFDRNVNGFFIPLQLILMAGFVFGGLSAGLTFLAVRTLRRPKQDYDLQMQRSGGRVIDVSENGLSGRVQALGEIWSFESQEPLRVSDEVEVLQRKQLTLVIRKKV